MKKTIFTTLFILSIFLSSYAEYQSQQLSENNNTPALSKLEIGEIKSVDGKEQWVEIKKDNFNPTWAYFCPLDIYFRENNTTIFKGISKVSWFNFSNLKVEDELALRLTQNKSSSYYLHEYENKINTANIIYWVGFIAQVYGGSQYKSSFVYPPDEKEEREIALNNERASNIYLSGLAMVFIIAPLYGGTAFDDLFKAIKIYNNSVSVSI